MSFTKDLSSYLTAYGTYTIGVKAHAEGFRDSETATTTYSNLPVLLYVDETELTFTNVMLGVSQIRLYIDNVLVDTITHDPTDTNDVSIDISSFNLDANLHEFYIVVTAPDKTGTVTTFTTETIFSNKIFGVSGLYAESPTLTRTDNAVGMTWLNSDGVITSDLDNEFPFNEIKEVTLDSGDVMIEFPEMWWRVGHDSSNRLTDVAVSKQRSTSGTWYKTPAFQIGKYLTSLSSGNLYSKSGQSVSTTPNGMKGYLYTAINKNMYFLTIYHYTILEFLFWIYFGTKDSNSVYSVEPTLLQRTGGLDTYANMNCIKNNRFKFMYIEDFIGNQMTMLCGSYSNSFYDVYNNQSLILNSTERSTTGKVALNYNTVSSNGTIKALGWDESHPFICMPIELVADNSYSTYFCDYCYYEAWRSTTMAPYVGKAYNHKNERYTTFSGVYVNATGLSYIGYTGVYSGYDTTGLRLVRFLD